MTEEKEVTLGGGKGNLVFLDHENPDKIYSKFVIQLNLEQFFMILSNKFI